MELNFAALTDAELSTEAERRASLWYSLRHPFGQTDDEAFVNEVLARYIMRRVIQHPEFASAVRLALRAELHGADGQPPGSLTQPRPPA